MREIILLNFGNSSNYLSTHFWNLNDEMFKHEDKFKIDHSVLYNDYYHPRNLIFDYSENIRPYFMSNEKLSQKAQQQFEEEAKNNLTNQTKVQKYEIHSEASKYIDLMNEISIDEEEYANFKKSHNDNNEYNQYNPNYDFNKSDVTK
jgi:hypothetical protein